MSEVANEKRLIYLEDAVSLLKKEIAENQDALKYAYHGDKGTIRSEISALRSAITILKHHANRGGVVDAVEVVRCKDCKYAMDMMPIENSGGCLMGECTLRKEDDIVFTAWGDEFCSYGERKDNGM